MKVKQLLIMAIIAQTVSAQAAVDVFMVFKKVGIPLEVLHSVTGLQSRDIATGLSTGKRQYQPMSCLYSLETGGGFLQSCITSTIAQHGSDALMSVHRCTSSSSATPLVGGGLDYSLLTRGVSSVTFPALVTASKSAGQTETDVDCDGLSFLGYQTISPSESTSISSEKAWLCSNFKLDINGITSSSTLGASPGVSRIEPFTIKPVFSPGGSGVYFTFQKIEMSVTAADAQQYFGWFLNVLSGLPDARTCKLTLTHNDGSLLCAMQMQVQIDTFGSTDVFALNGSPLYKVVLTPVSSVEVMSFSWGSN